MLDPLEPWGLELSLYHHDLSIPGSPERCVSRSVVEDSAGNMWLLERIASKQIERRMILARNLQALSEAGMARLLPYRMDQNGEFVSEVMGFSWQLSTFYKSDPLSRPGYISDGLCGHELADFLCDLRNFSVKTELIDSPDKLNLREYIQRLVSTISERKPDIQERVCRLAERLTPFIESISELPESFCHGDFHPLNVLWRGGSAGAVIDWEFCGLRPETYDMANLIGCAGFEHPSALDGEFVLSFVKGMGSSSIAEDSLRCLPSFVAALRFAWLSEWLRKKDHEMLEMELDYMELLLDNASKLEATWLDSFRQ